MVSAVAYTLWSVLLTYNPVSKVTIFGFVNPLCSVMLSALVLVCVGIYVVNCKKVK
ncbi:MAG: hypothetical protein PUD21_02790 [Clostridiaceae bacterium]|nr:hypothetical protein [Clostridiaceae bacterium]